MKANDILKNYQKSTWHTFSQIATYAAYLMEKKEGENLSKEQKEGQLPDDTKSTFWYTRSSFIKEISYEWIQSSEQASAKGKKGR